MSTVRKPPQLMGIAEVAAYIGAPRSTVRSWAVRGTHDMPPYAVLEAGIVWRTRDIVAWNAARLTRAASTN